MGREVGKEDLRGRPYGASVGSATKSVLYGDFRAACVVKASPLRVRISEDARFANDQLAIKVTQRLDIKVVDAAAAAYLVNANS